MLDRSSFPPAGAPLTQRGVAGGFAPYSEDRGGVEGDAIFDPLKLLFLILRYRWLVASMLALALASGFAATALQPPVYQSSVRLEVVSPSARVFQDLEVVPVSADQRAFLTARERLMSRPVAERVVYELGLAERVDFLHPAPVLSPSSLIGRAFGRDGGGTLDAHEPEERERRAVSRVLDGMGVTLVPNTSLLDISFRARNPQDARDIADQIARSFIDQRIDQTSETSELARQFIQEQVLLVKERLQESERALVDYAREAGVTVTGNERSLIVSRIESLNASLSKAMERRLEGDLLTSQIEQGRGDSLEDVLGSEPLQRLRSALVDLRAEYREKLTTFKPGFPEMRQLQTRIAELERQYGDGVSVILESIGMRREEAVRREAELRAQLALLQDEQVAYEDKNIRYTILRREVDSDRAQYDTLISKLNEVGVGSELRRENASVVEPALLPHAPAEPRLSVNLAVALALFGALGAAIVYIRERLDDSFTHPGQIETVLRLPVLGILPKVDRRMLGAYLDDPGSGLSEAYRSLRTSIQFCGFEGPPRTLMITSAEPGEGKSTAALKLAADFGALGKSVLVVDADLRKPSVHRQFGFDNAPGLSDVLANAVRRPDLPLTVRRTRHENVCVMTSGTVPPNPADLLSCARMALLVEHLAERFDLVIIDAPPVIGLSDAPILARLADATLLVVSADGVSRKGANAALKRLQSAGANVIGATLSRFSVSAFDGNEAYRYLEAGYYGNGAGLPKLENRGGADGCRDGIGTLLDRLGGLARGLVARLVHRLKPVD